MFVMFHMNYMNYNFHVAENAGSKDRNTIYLGKFVFLENHSQGLCLFLNDEAT